MKLDVKKYVEERKKILKKNFRATENPKLCIIANNYNSATLSYLKSKKRIGEELGVEVDIFNAKKDDIVDISDRLFLNSYYKIPTILQLPTSDKVVEDTYNQNKFGKCVQIKDIDVDGFFAYEDIVGGDIDKIVPATPKGIVKFIQYWCKQKNKDMGHLTVTILGRGKLIGSPCLNLLRDKVGTINLITSKSTLEQKQFSIKNSDIVILATGNKNSLDGINDFGKDKLIVDSGIFRGDDGKLFGELTPHINKLDKSVDYTPVPNGVGILTTLELFDNVFKFYNKDQE